MQHAECCYASGRDIHTFAKYAAHGMRYAEKSDVKIDHHRRVTLVCCAPLRTRHDAGVEYICVLRFVAAEA